MWCLRELKRLGVQSAIAPQARAFVMHGYLTEDDIAGFVDELRGGPAYKPPPIAKQLDLPIEHSINQSKYTNQSKLKDNRCPG